jgi:hypothetical protein
MVSFLPLCFGWMASRSLRWFHFGSGSSSSGGIWARGRLLGHKAVSLGFRSAFSGLYRQTLNPPPAVATAAAAFFPGSSILPRGRCALKKAAAWPFSAALRPVGCGRRLGGGFGRAVRKAAMNAASNTQHGVLP